ncbi:ribonuclease H-like domain-containing protein [Tanacetum coccineum]
MDTLSFDDLYNNLRVFESDIKGSTASSSSSPQNVAFVSENTNSTNEVSTAYCVPNLSGQNTKYEQTSSYSLLANQSSCPQLDHEDLEQIDEYDLEEMDLKWQVAMISMRMKKFYKKTGRKLQFDAKEAVGFDKTKVECYNCHKTGHFARECRIKGSQDNKRREAWNSGNKDGNRTGQKEDSKALVTIDGEGVDWTTHSEDEDYALMACNSSDSDTEVISCSTKCKESYANLKKLYDAQREQLNDASIEIKAYSQIYGILKPSELVSEPVVSESNVESQPKVWSDAPIIEEYESDSEDECVDIPTKQQETPSFANQQVKTPRENVKILNHLIRDCDFHEKRMARKVDLNNGWNNVHRVNKQHQFVPSAVLTRTNKLLVTKPHNKTPYELLTGKIPIISYIRPFGCHVTILNTIDHLGKFAGKSDEGFLVGYSLQSKAFRVYNLETKRVEENLHITFLENKPNVAGKGPNWLFDLDYLTDSMNYHPVSSENQANHAGQQEANHAGQQEANQHASTEEIIDVVDSDKEDESAQDCFVLPIWPSYSSTTTPAITTVDKREGPREEEQVFVDDLERLKKQEKEACEEAEALRKKFETLVIKEGAAKPSSTNIFSTVSTPAKASSTNLVNTVSLPVSTASPHEGLSLADPTHSEEDDSEIPPLEDIYQSSTDGIFTTSSFDDEGAVADFTNLETVVNVSPIPTHGIHYPLILEHYS